MPKKRLAKAKNATVRLPWPLPKLFGRPTPPAKWWMICLIGASLPARPLKRSKAGDGAMPCIPTTEIAPRPFGPRRCVRENSMKSNIVCAAATANTADVSVRGVPVLEKDGSISEWVGTCVDITERKQMEEELRKASLYARSLIEASLDPLVTISPSGQIMDVNKATEMVTGVAREQLIGSDFSTYFTDPEKANEGYHTVLSQGFVTDYPLTIRHTSGRTTDVLYNATVYRNEAGEVQGVFAAARDVTEHKRMDKELHSAAQSPRTPGGPVAELGLGTYADRTARTPPLGATSARSPATTFICGAAKRNDYQTPSGRQRVAEHDSTPRHVARPMHR